MIPNSIEEVKELTNVAHLYYADKPLAFLSIFSLLYLAKQALAIPGSFFLNLLAGAVIGNHMALPLVCLMTAMGASLCFLLSSLIGSLFRIYNWSSVQKLSNSIDKNRSNLFWYLVTIRIFPFTPNWLLNLASPWLRIPLRTFFFSMLIGTVPYALVSTQAGLLLNEIESVNDIITPSIVMKLSFISILALLPTLLRKRLTARFVN